ncbi:MAG: mechanosensitive ion channel family protein [Deltaproteobacteria bacterium HGW-Deltaproteobacteria-14]|jgi:MscS family membrane protein|nr:MAG: mechanosensitive ion channel family protein [Deltaproteobacteria bacterium HGW-Deltaproteobacteria-14]
MRLPRLLLLALLLLLAPPALAQLAPAPAAEAGEAKAEVPKALASPRATMQTFLTEAVAAADGGGTAHLDAAAACLDLSAIPAPARLDSGRELAIKLKEVLDRIRLVDYATIPANPEGPPYVFDRDADTGVSIVIARAPSGEWRFTTETVAGIDDLFRSLEARAKVAGVAGSPANLSPSLWLRSKMPDALKKVGFLMEHWQWLTLALLVIFGVLFARLVRFLLMGPVSRRLDQRELGVPRELVARTLSPLGLIVMAIFWVTGLSWVGLSPDLHSFFVVIVKFLAAFALVRFAFRIVDIMSHVLATRAAKTEGRFDDLLVPLFRKSVKVVIFAVGVVFIADVVGISASSLLAGLGLGGLAIALAAQDTVKNFFGSLTVILDRPFEVGDAVIIGGSTEGVVEEVGFRSTRIRTYENSLITLPNATFISAQVDNLGARNWRRLKATIGVTYDTPPDKLRAFTEGLRELIRNHPLTKKEGYAVYFNGLGASSLDILFITHFETKSFDAAAKGQHDLLLSVVTLASRLGVEFAFPTRTVVLQKGGAAPPTQTYAPADAARVDADHRLGREEALRILGKAPVTTAGAPDASD